MRKNKNQKIIIKDQSLIDDRKKTSKVIKEITSSTKLKKVVEWNYKTNQIVYIKQGYCTLVTANKKNTTSIVIDDEYVLVVADRQFKGISVEENFFFVLYRGSIYKISGKFLKQI